jgi:hypothetical protein
MKRPKRSSPEMGARVSESTVGWGRENKKQAQGNAFVGQNASEDFIQGQNWRRVDHQSRMKNVDLHYKA